MQQFDLVVIGAGPGGYVAAIRAAQKGLNVAVVESREVGGTCLNRGCVPTKALIHSGHIYEEIKSSAQFGVFTSDVSYNLEKIHEHKESVVTQLRGGVEQLLKANKVTVFNGLGKLIKSGETRVELQTGETITLGSKFVIIATGSVPAIPPIPGHDLEDVLISDSLLLGSPKDYKSLVIIGGGVIGVEFANFYNSIGCHVTIIESNNRLLRLMDEDVSQNLTAIFKKRGVKINTGCTVTEIKKDGEELTVCFEVKEKGTQKTATAEGVLIAIGRRANTKNVFDENLGINLERGTVLVDENFKTNIENVYAIGDVTGGMQLAHVASAQGIAAVEHMLGEERSTNVDVIPSCIYTYPEIASVGLNATEAEEKGFEVEVGKYQINGNSKTVIEKGDRGFVKVVFDKKSQKLIGAQMFCNRATDMISELSVGVVNGLTKAQFLKVMRPHPTFSEAVTEACECTDGTSIHTMPAAK